MEGAGMAAEVATATAVVMAMVKVVASVGMVALGVAKVALG